MIDIQIYTQPDDESCGPTCLHSIYHYYGLQIPLPEIVQTIDRSASGGTLAPMLGKHALQQGMRCTLYVNNLNLFDPTWFKKGKVKNTHLIQKLKQQWDYKQQDEGLVIASRALCEYLELGGEVRYRPLNIGLFKKYINQNQPIITGLSATYLYNSARELFTDEGISQYDDIRGTPCGHFVIICGYDEDKRHVVVADPHRENPISHNNYYKVSLTRLINAILLGVLTYDATLLIIEPKVS